MLRLGAWLLLLITLCPTAPAAAARPKLVLLLIVDQFRADYLERFRAEFVPGGFNRLLTRGAVFANTNYDYATTETAPGHATLATGALPANHGIVANDWYDRERKRETSAVEDPDYRLLGINASAPGASPRKLLGTSLADELRLAEGGQAQVVAIALKARAAVLPGGKNPTAVFWLDAPTGRVVTSTYYTDTLPSWVQQFNAKHDLSALVGRKWLALGGSGTATPLAVIEKLTGSGNPGVGVGPDSTFFANEDILGLAQQAVLAYRLGRGPATDFLSVSLSPNDYLGHFAGPDSALMRDMVLRTDRMLADFFRFLDTQVGPGSVLVAFSADHGVAPLPEVLREKRIEAGRVSEQDASKVIEAGLRKTYGSGAAQEKEEPWVEWVELPNVYLSRSLTEKYKVTAEEVARRAGEAALQMPGILTYFTAAQITRSPGADLVARRVAHSFFRGRSGDVILVWKPFYQKALKSGRGTSHNSPWSYDTHVPLIFMGPDFHPGVYQTPATPADLAPTIAAVLGINPPAVATGRVLTGALAATARSPQPANRTHGPQR